jgi:hypothetical protein
MPFSLVDDVGFNGSLNTVIRLDNVSSTHKQTLTLAMVVKKKLDDLLFMTNNRLIPVKNTFG